MDITVIVVCYNEEKNIEDCLGSLLRQEYSLGRIQILIIDNNSIDETRSIVHKYVEEFPDSDITLKINPVRGISGSRKLGVTQARFPFIAFIDADCVAPSDWISTLANCFSKNLTTIHNLAGVGGSNIPPKDKSLHYKALAIMLNSFLGSHGSVQGMCYRKDRYVRHLSCVNVLFRKQAILEVGNFDTSMNNIGEDTDISYRLVARGYALLYCSESCVVHKLRPTLTSWGRNMFIYGYGRAYLIVRYPSISTLKFFAPMLLVMFLAVSLIFQSRLAAILFLCYLFLIFLYCFVRLLLRRQLFLLPLLFTLYVATHLSYGTGEIYGFGRRLFARST